MSDTVESVQALEATIGKPPPGVALKVIDHLDATARHWLTTAPLMFAGIGDAANYAVTLGGGAPGFAIGEERVLRLPLPMLDDPDLVRIGASFGSLFLAPGIGETLRVNGRVAAVDDGWATVAVEECYGHCAKALIRSEFWKAQTDVEVPSDAADFVAASRFMALATVGVDGAADLSPKGDPTGMMASLRDGALWFADRPGNRRLDSFRNLLDQPRLAAALLIPGSNHVAIVEGEARLTTDEAMRAAFAVKDKMPQLAIRVGELSLRIRKSGALERARLWPNLHKAEGIDPAKMFVQHLKLNKDKGLGARLASAVVSIPGLMQKGLDKDYENNLY